MANESNYFAQYVNEAQSDSVDSGNYFAQFLNQDKPESGLWATIKGGAGQTARSAGAALDLAQGDLPELQQAVSEQQSRIKDPRLQKFESDLQARKEQLGQDPGWMDTIGAVGKAAWQNPSGFGLMMAEQLPNSAAVMAAGGAGALAGSALGPAGAVAGGVIGGIGGMFAGNVALESGGKALEHVAKTGALTDQDRGRLLTEGAIKAGVITGVDALTFGASKWVTGTAKRAAEVAAVRVAEQQGVPVAEVALRRAADPAFNAAVESAEQLAVAGANQLGKRALQTGAALTLETIGEGAGEYLGEFAATGEADKMDAVIESFSSLGQSAAEVAIGKALNRRATAPSIAAITDPAATVDQAAQAAAAFVDGANVLDSMGFSQDEIAAITADSGLMAPNQTTSPQGPSNGPAEAAETPAEAVAQQAQQQVSAAAIGDVQAPVNQADAAATPAGPLQGMASPAVVEPANQAAAVLPATANAVGSDGRDVALQGVIDHLGERPATMGKIPTVEEKPAAKDEYQADDPFYNEAVQLVRQVGKASIPMVQRHLRIGYNRAARLIEIMGNNGLISPVKADGTRDVLEPAIAATPVVEPEAAIRAQQTPEVPKIGNKPVTEIADKMLVQLAKSKQPVGEIARQEIARREVAANNAGIGAQQEENLPPAIEVKPSRQLKETGNLANDLKAWGYGKIPGIIAKGSDGIGKVERDILLDKMRNAHYLVDDEEHMIEMLKDVADGKTVLAAPQQEAKFDKEESERIKQRIYDEAERRGIPIKGPKGKLRPFNKVEADYTKLMNARRERANALMEERAKKAYDQMMAEAVAAMGEDNVANVLDQAAEALPAEHNAKTFYQNVTKHLKGAVYEIQQRNNGPVEQPAERPAGTGDNGRGREADAAGNEGEVFALRGQTQEEARAEIARQDAAAAQKLADEAKAQAAERKARDEADIKARQDIGADAFELTPQVNDRSKQKAADKKAADDQLAGQGDIFGQVEQKKEQEMSPRRTASIRKVDGEGWLVEKFEPDGALVSSKQYDVRSDAENEKAKWETGYHTKEKPLHTQESDIDAAATRGYQAGLKGETTPPFEYSDVQLDAWLIGNRRGREDQAAIAKADEQPQDGDVPKAPVTEEALESVGLLRQFNGRWQYKFSADGRWMTANAKESAVEMATDAYNQTPADQRLTRAQRDDKADAELIAEMNDRYGKMSIMDIRAEINRLSGIVESNQKAGAREFNGNGGRRTRAAVSNEAARAAGEDKLKLGIYLDHRIKMDKGAGFNSLESPRQPKTITVDGIERPTTNSKGQPIARTEEGLRNFWRWFGDSKVVDEAGRPLVVYHGTPHGVFSEFEASDEGIWFTTDIDHAASYSGNYTDVQDYHDGYITDEEAEQMGLVYSAYLKAEKMPPSYDFKGRDWRGEDPDGNLEDIGLNTHNLANSAADSGFDGVQIRNIIDPGPEEGTIDYEVKPETQYAVFSPTQIKSATGNRGTFDPNDANILNSLEEYQQAAREKAIDRAILRAQGETVPPIKRAAAKFRIKQVIRKSEAGTITDAQFGDEVESIDQKLQPAPLKRGATQARIRLLQAKRDGELSADAADLADWFIQKNPALFSDVGVSIEEDSPTGAAGNYDPINQVIRLFKGAASDTTAVHEVLHHLERMMPAEMQDAIRKEWLRATTAELQKAIKAKDQARIDYFSAVLAGDTERATKLLTGGAMSGFNLPAFHGSPHRFSKFSLEHLGSGEGAQAFGWGLYMASSREVAEFYKRTLERPEVASDAEHPMAKYVRREIERLEREHGIQATGKEWLDAAFQKMAEPGSPNEDVGDAYFEMIDDGEITFPGQLYRVEIPDEGNYLLWDAPLSEQPEAVKDALNRTGKPGTFAVKLPNERGGWVVDFDADRGGKQVYSDLTKEFGSQEEASKYLNSLGIAGIKYLDGTSRAAGEGQFNFVIFDDAAVQILETYYSLAYADYQYLNPSEFWAVRMTARVAAQFAAKDSIWQRSKMWLKEALEKIKSVLGLKSDAPLLRALDRLIKDSDGFFVSDKMLGEGETFNASSRTTITVDGVERPTTEPEWYSLSTAERRDYYDPDAIEESGEISVFDFDENKWWKFSSKKKLDAFRRRNPFAALSSVAGENKTWYRFGAPPEGARSFNSAENFAEEGVSVYATPAGSNPFFLDRKVFTGTGRQVGWGSDGEPLIIPTSTFVEYFPPQRESTDANILNSIEPPKPLHTTVNQPPLIQPAGRVPPPQQTSLNIGQGSVQPTWTMPEDNLTEDLIYRLQDNKIDLKRAIEAIRATGKQIGEAIDAYRQEERYISRAAERTKQFLEKDMTQLLTLMRLNRVDQEQLGRYLWARHAEEANAHIAKINPTDPDMQDGGSGMLTQEAKDYLAGKSIKGWPALTAAELRSMGILAARVDAITKGTRDYLVANGLLSPSDKAIWEAAYKHYVPLNREDMDTMTHGNGTGQGFSIKGPESKRRTGSKLPVADVLGNIAQQRVKAITRAEKNRVAIALYGLVLQNPNPDFWKADAPPKIKVIQKIQGIEQVVEMVDPLYKSKDNVIIAKVYNQKSGKVEERSVLFNERNERAMRLARAMKNLDGTQMGELMSAAATVTRYFASINTQYNPIFGIVNLVRDVQTAAINLTSTPLAGHKLKVMSNAAKIFGGALRHGLRDFDGKWKTLAEEYRLEGGATGFMENFRTGKDRAESLEKILDPDWWTKTKWGKALTLNGFIEKPVTLAVDKTLRPLAEWISDFNTVMEQATRLAAYDVARNDLKMSQAASASLAKNLTVNFNRKGELGTQIGSLYAFFNASMQGSARMAETILKRDSNGKYRLSKAGKQIIGGGILLGALQAVALMAAGFDDDEPPEFVRARNLLIPTGGKDYLSIPMPLGFNLLPNLGRLTVEAIAHPKKAKEKAAGLIGTIADSFNPLGGSAPISQIISPTITDPLIALATNTDWTGKPIAREDFNSLAPTPGFSRAKDVASAPSRWLSEAINTLTFGTNDKQGILSPTPDQIDYLIGQVTGGVGREALKASATASALTSGEELPWHKVPLVGRFYGSTEGQSSQGNTFYANIKAMNEHEASIKGRAKRGESVAEYLAENPEAKLYQYANTTERMIQGLKRQKQAAVEREDKDAVKRYEQAITTTMQRFNQRVAQAEARN